MKRFSLPHFFVGRLHHRPRTGHGDPAERPGWSERRATMMYAASSRRSKVRLQRQASSRRTLVVGDPRGFDVPSRPTSSSSHARPCTADSFRAGRRPTTPYKGTSADDGGGAERIRRCRDAFLLKDEDLDRFRRSFRAMAAGGGGVAPSSSSPPAKPQKSRKERRRKNKAAGKKTSSGDVALPPREEPDAPVALSISDFFAALCSASNGGFLDALFDLVGTRDLHAIAFGEYLEAVCAYATFKLDDLVRFAFFALDKGGEGRIPRAQLLRFVESLHQGRSGVSFEAFRRAILPDAALPNEGPILPAAERERSSVDYPGLWGLCGAYPALFEPLLLFQDSLRRRVMGYAWWRRKEKEVERHFRTLDGRREKARRREERRLLRERRGDIRSEIGWIPYYSQGKARGEAEKGHPRPIVILEEETGKICVEWTRTDGDEGDDGSIQTDEAQQLGA
ncbi:hypothetical protein ACHAWF_012390 [Thalassiosira exigua]